MNREQQLFDRLKQSPTELNLEEVNTIISTLPDLSPPTSGRDLINLKFLSVFIISAITLSVILFTSKKEFNNINKSKAVAIELEKIGEEKVEVLTNIKLANQKKYSTRKDIETNTESILELIKSSTTTPILLPTLSVNLADMIPFDSTAGLLSDRMKPTTSRSLLLPKLPIKPFSQLESTTFALPIQFDLPPITSSRDDGYSIRLLEIKFKDTIQKLKEMEAILESRGLNIEISHHYNTKKLLFESISIHFMHAQGMNFKLVGTGFERLQMKLFLNERQQIQYFTYRFNKETFTNPVPLHCKGQKSHQYSENMVGISGSTNVNLGHERLDSN